MEVLREIKRLPDAIHRLTSAIQALIQLQKETGPGEARLEELERSRATWEAEMEALLLKADSSYKSARNAEERERKLKKAHEKEILDPFAPESEAAEASIVSGRHAPAGEEEGMLPVHLDVAPFDPKAYALRAKYNV